MTTIDLRARRRTETRRLVGDTAVQLFLEKGYASTTVDDIAQAAGVSARTFFRLFPSKEEAALVGLLDIEDSIDAIDFTGASPRAAVALIEDMYVDSLVGMTATADSRAAQLLISTEPAIQRAVHLRHAALSERLRTRLVAEFGDGSELVAHLIVDVTGGTLHAALSTWGEQSQESPGIEADALYDEARAVLRTLFA